MVYTAGRCRCTRVRWRRLMALATALDVLGVRAVSRDACDIGWHVVTLSGPQLQSARVRSKVEPELGAHLHCVQAYLAAEEQPRACSAASRLRRARSPVWVGSAERRRCQGLCRNRPTPQLQACHDCDKRGARIAARVGLRCCPGNYWRRLVGDAPACLATRRCASWRFALSSRCCLMMASERQMACLRQAERWRCLLNAHWHLCVYMLVHAGCLCGSPASARPRAKRQHQQARSTRALCMQAIVSSLKWRVCSRQLGRKSWIQHGCRL